MCKAYSTQKKHRSERVTLKMSIQNVPLVSILIPSVKIQWLDLCICSCLSQTFQNFEILIGDDSPDFSVTEVSEKWADNRIKVFKNPTPNVHGSNRRQLLAKSIGKYVKYVFDDDFLQPTSVEKLVKACEKNQAAMSFHLRQTVNTNGARLPNFVSMPEQKTNGETINIEVPPRFLATNLVNNNTNFIGEPSNCLFRSDFLKQQEGTNEDLFSRRMLFLGDVKSHVNAMLTGKSIICVPEYLSFFRVHQNQNSQGKKRPAGYYEWDIIRRYFHKKQLLSKDEFEAGLKNQIALYETMPKDFSLKNQFLEIAKESNERNNYLTNEFNTLIETADQILLAQ